MVENVSTIYEVPLKLKEQGILKEIYKKIDYCVPLRGHGQMISAATNTPFVSLSTQDKVLIFAKNNGFSEYNVDIHESDWYSKWESKIRKLSTNKEYLCEWYEIRDQNMQGWTNQFDNYCERVVRTLERKE